MDAIKNQRIAEYFIISLVIGIGTPVCILWGFQDGHALAAKVYAIKSNPPDSGHVSGDPAVFLPSAENVDKGRDLFQKNCTPCHGEHADGKGPAAVALTPPPRNFTDPGAKWTRSRDPQDIFKTITEGSPGTAMPPFSNSLTGAERWALVHYLGTLPGVRNQFHPIDENEAKTLAAKGSP